MAFIGKIADTFYAFRFLRLLTTPWDKTGAFKLGIIDKDGRVIRSPETPDEQSKYTLFHRLVFNLKRLLNKIPLGKTTLASYVAAFWLLKENSGLSEKQLKSLLEDSFGIDIVPSETMSESVSAWYIHDDATKELVPGVYTLMNEIALPKTGEPYCRAGTSITISEGTVPVGTLFGHDVYKVHHVKTSSDIFVTLNDIAKAL